MVARQISVHTKFGYIYLAENVSEENTNPDLQNSSTNMPKAGTQKKVKRSSSASKPTQPRKKTASKTPVKRKNTAKPIDSLGTQIDKLIADRLSALVDTRLSQKSAPKKKVNTTPSKPRSRKPKPLADPQVGDFVVHRTAKRVWKVGRVDVNSRSVNHPNKTDWARFSEVYVVSKTLANQWMNNLKRKEELIQKMKEEGKAKLKASCESVKN